ncbi:ISPsy8, transposase OrfA [Lentilactobacillus sunkii DSM 19904]|uniref:ISPsy8, transposase OrfA n=2 Tax=Lentilactobacillus sunkii TaxID=481719 RepID=A0A0R1KR56_9LACO|nr:helix-turn-helix domain-containing protein [Lentilactobacillus sunkii]KRK85701.1 ISPsy8, transposase OrfA [Lentilactobacillus sunkii DSM 19904]
MTKYSSKFKIKVVSRYFKGDIGYHDLCKQYHTSYGCARVWVQQAREQGIQSLEVKRSRATYSQSFKLAVIEYVRTHQISRAQAAAHFGISSSQVYAWNQIVDEQGVAGLRSKKRGKQTTNRKYNKSIKHLQPNQEEKYQQEILELKQRLHKAELDRDILKALATLTKKARK